MREGRGRGRGRLSGVKVKSYLEGRDIDHLNTLLVSHADRNKHSGGKHSHMVKGPTCWPRTNAQVDN